MKQKLIIILLFFATFLQAQDKKEPVSLSLKEAIDYAIKNNYAAINSGRDIDIAKQKKWETTAMGLPQINGNISYQNNFKLQTSVIPAEFFGGNPGEFAEVTFGTKHNATGSLTLSQLLFDGSYIVALQASKVYLQFYENYKKKTDAEVKEMIVNSYGSVLLADENIQILQKNKTILEKTLFETDQTFKNGFIEEENVEQLKITLASLNSNLNYVSRLKDISLKMLKLNLGIPIENELTLTDKLNDLAQNNLDLAINSNASIFNAKSNINYMIAQNFVDQRSLELKLQKSKALPTLSAVVNYGYNSFSDSFNFFNQDQKYFNFSNLGVNLSVPIFSSFGRRAKTTQAKIALEQSKTQLTEAEQQLNLQYQKAKSDYEFSVEQLTSSKNNLILSERIEHKQQIKFKEGLSTSFELTNAQKQLYSSQQNYLQALLEVINKRASIEKITNN
jgi:outer membrane protein TolC